MSSTRPPDTVLIVAPVGADATNLQTVLRRAGHHPRICRTVEDVQSGLAGECGAVVLTEEALTPELQHALTRIFENQPPWSDIPIVLIATVGPSNFGPL